MYIDKTRILQPYSEYTDWFFLHLQPYFVLIIYPQHEHKQSITL